MRLIKVGVRSLAAVPSTLEFYMGKNTPDRRDYIVELLVVCESLQTTEVYPDGFCNRLRQKMATKRYIPQYFWMTCQKKMPMTFIPGAIGGVLYLDGMAVSFRIWTGYSRFFQSVITIASRLPVQGQYC